MNIYAKNNRLSIAITAGRPQIQSSELLSAIIIGEYKPRSHQKPLSALILDHAVWQNTQHKEVYLNMKIVYREFRYEAEKAGSIFYCRRMNGAYFAPAVAFRFYMSGMPFMSIRAKKHPENGLCSFRGIFAL
jgi:hypothetical protein